MNKDFIQTHFTKPLLKWYDAFGRKNLPWQNPKDPYRVWISEIMLQQTQVQTVIPYFNRFMDEFPSVHALAQSDEDRVMSLWSGLGYYSRARNLHKTARIISEKYQGQFPQTLDLLTDLPGIGPSTAAAILSLAFNQPTPILDGNVKRVLARFFLIKGYPEQSAINKIFWEYAHLCMPTHRCAEYTQAIMDMGATCCTSKHPDCKSCPLQIDCQAHHYNEQHAYPTKKPKKPNPIKEEQFLILQNDEGMIYLEKRPPTGLWGGLWCFPSIELHACPLSFIHSQYGFHGENPEHVISFKHQFSHFQLNINALKIKTHMDKTKLYEHPGQWYSFDEIKGLGLAKPTTHILSKLHDDV